MASLVYILPVLLLLPGVPKVRPRVMILDPQTPRQPLVPGEFHDNGEEHLSATLRVEGNGDSCNHLYGFLPCADNIGGYIFQIFVFECLLVAGDYLVAGGSLKLFEIFDVGFFGAFVFRFLMTLPKTALILVSALSGGHAVGQSMVVNAVGITTGSTVLTLTLQWGASILCGLADITNKDKTEPKDSGPHSSGFLKSLINLRKSLTRYKNSSVRVDQKTARAAGIMLLSFVPFLILQLSKVSDSPSWTRRVVLATLIISALALLSFFTYQYLDQSDQKRSLKLTREELLLTDFFTYIQKGARESLNRFGELNEQTMSRVFMAADKDGDGHISRSEVDELVSNINSGRVLADKPYEREELIDIFDTNADRKISIEEFKRGCQKARELVEKGESSSSPLLRRLKEAIHKWIEGRRKELDRIPQRLSDLWLQGLLSDATGDQDEIIESLFKKYDKNNDGKIDSEELRNAMAEYELQNLNVDEAAKTFMQEFDKDDDNALDKKEISQGLANGSSKATTATAKRADANSVDGKPTESWRDQKVPVLKATTKIVTGTVIVVFLGRPLILNINHLSSSINIPSFFISFVLIPLATSVRPILVACIQARLHAERQKKDNAASLIFSEIYGGVTVNNALGLLTILVIIYAKNWEWNYSSHVFVASLVGLAIGVHAFLHSAYWFWTSIVAISLYPISLGLFYVFVYVIRWG